MKSLDWLGVVVTKSGEKDGVLVGVKELFCTVTGLGW